MGATGLTGEKIKRLLYRSRNSREVVASSPSQMKADADIRQIGDYVAEMGKTGDARSILQTELALLREERNYLSNSKVQEGSLDTAIEGLTITLNLLEKVRIPESYSTIDEAHGSRKRRSGGLPLDEAREFFKSHNSQLLYLDKAILSDEEKALIDIRRANIRKAGKMYIAMQQQTLGIAPPQQDRDLSL